MIVFDLQCGTRHVFEAWFGSTEDFEDQKRRGLVSCPLCGASDVEKALMAPRLGVKGNSQPDLPAPAQMKAAMQALAKAQNEMLKGSDYVGASFANQARAMHVGEIAHRPIHGQATPQEAKSLVEEGVAIAPLPLPVRPPETDH